MGFSIHVYVGPYAKFTVDRVSKPVEQDFGKCCGQKVGSRFCGRCGAEVPRAVEFETNDAISECNVADAIDERLRVMQNGHEGSHVWMPNGGGKVKIPTLPDAKDTCEFDLNPGFMELCKAKFVEAYAPTLKKMAKIYGREPVVCFGVVSDWW